MGQAPKHIVIVGYGEMGHAIEHVLDGAHDIAVWQRRAPSGGTPVDLAALTENAEFVFLCVPANPVRSLAGILRGALRRDSVCLAIAKGLDEDGNTAATVLEDVLGDRCGRGVIYGPMIAEELRADKPGFAQVGTDVATYRRVRALFQGTRLYVEHCRDVTGLSWSVVLKNVYAILFGAADELGLGDNMRGYLAVGALRELSSIVGALGGEGDTPLRLAGLGDLITTATSPGSHHRELGRLLVRGDFTRIEGEGIHTIAMLHKAPRFCIDDYPLLALADRLVRTGADAATAFAAHLEAAFSRAEP